MSWQARLSLAWRSEPWPGEGGDTRRTVLHDRHQGPLRVLASLYPEGPNVCHNVLVHPPGGVVGGDGLHVDAALADGAHALVTTPGATRFYRSAGALAEQTLDARLGRGARLEWLPLETIVHAGARAESRLRFALGAGAEMIGWDVLALGLPASGQPFDGGDGAPAPGRYTQHIELPGVWLERGTVDAGDRRLLDSPLGWAGRRVLATLWFASGTPLVDGRRDALLRTARDAAAAHPLAASAGASSPHAEAVVLRVLAHRVEPAMALLQTVRAHWRAEAWSLAACAPRVWRT